jgi:TatD DNase family protein
MVGMSLFDTHAHLDFPQFSQDREEVLASLRAHAVAVINVGADLASSEASLNLARAYPFVFPSCGVHPHDAKTFSPEAERRLEDLLRSGAVAVGECGLDFYRDLSPREVQVRAFRTQLRLARKLDLPVILHERAAWDVFVAVLREEGPLRGVVHAFSGDERRAQEVLALGLHLGIGGPLTYPKNERLRQAVAKLPLHRILVETDSPYLPPEPARGKRNDPRNVALVLERLASILSRPVGELAEVTWENACRLFGVTPRF